MKVLVVLIDFMLFLNLANIVNRYLLQSIEIDMDTILSLAKMGWRHRKRERDRQTDRQTNNQRQRGRERNKERERDRERETERAKETKRQ